MTEGRIPNFKNNERLRYIFKKNKILNKILVFY